MNRHPQANKDNNGWGWMGLWILDGAPDVDVVVDGNMGRRPILLRFALDDLNMDSHP